MVTYDLGFDLAACFLSSLCIVYTAHDKKIRHNLQHTAFMALLANVLATAAADLCAMLAQCVWHSPDRVLMLFSTVYYLLHVLMVPQFTDYIFWVNGTRLALGKKKLALLSIPFLISAALIMTNPVTHLIFYYENGVYYREKIWILFVLILPYLILGYITLVHTRRETPMPYWRVTMLCTAVCLIGFVLQMMQQGILAEIFIDAIGFLIIMRVVESDQRMFDQTSLLMNGDACRWRIRQIYAQNVPVRLVSVRLSNLSIYADTLGTDDYDMLLLDVAGWIRRNMSASNVLIYQYSMNRYVFLILDGDQQTASEMEELIRMRMKKPWKGGRHSIRLNSVILSLKLPQECPSMQDLTEMLNMEKFTTAGSARILGRKEMSGLQRLLDVAECIRGILYRNRGELLQVFYQPIWDSRTGRISACEALLRVTDPELGAVPAEEVVKIAEQAGMIHDLDSLVLEKVCRFIHKCQPQQYGLKTVDINLSLMEMLSPDLVPDCRRIMQRYGVPVDMLTIEFIETQKNDAFGVYGRAREKLLDAGFSLSLDDFGTEYSNMNRLFDTKFTYVKMDKSLLWNAVKNTAAEHLLTSMLKMLDKMGYITVQEGVENQEQLDLVTSSGCELVQGYYFSRPLPEEDFLEYIRAFNSGSSDNKGGIYYGQVTAREQKRPAEDYLSGQCGNNGTGTGGAGRDAAISAE